MTCDRRSEEQNRYANDDAAVELITQAASVDGRADARSPRNKKGRPTAALLLEVPGIEPGA